MSDFETLDDEIDVIDLEQYACSGKPIPKHATYYLIKVDGEKIRVKSPITATNILIAADLEPCDYQLLQIKKGEKPVPLEPDALIDLTDPGIEKFNTKPTKEITIIVNGRFKKVDGKKLTFDEIVELAFENPPTGEFICFTITFRKGTKQNPEGTVEEDGSVKIKCGMVFNVTATDKS